MVDETIDNIRLQGFPTDICSMMCLVGGPGEKTSITTYSILYFEISVYACKMIVYWKSPSDVQMYQYRPELLIFTIILKIVPGTSVNELSIVELSRLQYYIEVRTGYNSA